MIFLPFFASISMVEKQVSLKQYNTFGMDVTASLFMRIQDAQQLKSTWKTTLIPHSNTFILGGGSNILFTQDYSGLILKNELKGKELLKQTDGYVWVKLGAGEVWHGAVTWAVENGWGGIENLSLIPGTVGAAPIQNIGAYGAELEQTFDSLEAFDLLEGKMVTLTHSECKFGYRDSIFKKEGKGRFFILSVTLKLSKNTHVNTGYGDIAKTLEEWGIQNPSIADVSRAVIHIRQTKLPDPAQLGNCGSFFKNPVVPVALAENIKQQFPEVRTFHAGEGMTKLSAAWLIEQAGWKGFRRGDAGVHTRQALVLVNYGQATGSEVKNLAEEIRADIYKKFSVELEMEVNLL